jgi:hypothetical protein
MVFLIRERYGRLTITHQRFFSLGKKPPIFGNTSQNIRKYRLEFVKQIM